MAIAKVILNDVSQIDLTSDTVTAESLLSGYTAHDASGTQITGTASGGENVWSEITAVSSASNAMQCFVLLFPNATVGSVCHAQIINKAQSDYAENQLIAIAQCHDTSSSYTMAGIRWRSNSYNYFYGSTAYDAVINIGDKYIISEVSL